MSQAILPPSSATSLAKRAEATAAPVRDPRADKIRHAAKEFESMMVKQLLKSAKLAGPTEDKANGYGDMAVDALASAVERGGGLGLARRIEDAIGAAHSSTTAATTAAVAPPPQKAEAKGPTQ